ncbi:HotDog domain-containing protein [Cladochytrium replicatum]|nr:HotDog domain-containing protein [Cladochytrium replicatum]
MALVRRSIPVFALLGAVSLSAAAGNLLINLLNSPKPPGKTKKQLDAEHAAEIFASHESDPFFAALDRAYAHIIAFAWVDDSNIERWYNHLTAGTLAGENRLAHYPKIYFAKDEDLNQETTSEGILRYVPSSREVIEILHFGKSLCGHDGIVHGGFLATILDEATAKTAIPHLPGKTGFTANLNINYRRPVPADRFYIAYSRLTKVDGRKAFTEGKIRAVVHVEATALFIAPRPATAQ